MSDGHRDLSPAQRRQLASCRDAINRLQIEWIIAGIEPLVAVAAHAEAAATLVGHYYQVRLLGTTSADAAAALGGEFERAIALTQGAFDAGARVHLTCTDIGEMLQRLKGRDG
jgi:plasmid replication initiation protein